MAKQVQLTSKQAAQRAELHKQIWSIADSLRGAVDGWDFKQYILSTLFYRYISEYLTNYFNTTEHEAGELEFDYANISDEMAEQYFKAGTVEAKGFFIYPSQLFKNVVKTARNNEELNIQLHEIFQAIEGSAKGTKAEESFKGLFSNVNLVKTDLGQSVSERNKKLADVLEGIAAMQLDDFNNNDIDLFGDAYEFLISNYASNAGKSGGEFFTPQSVSKLLAKIVTFDKTQINKVYDPTCGSGSLLLQVAKEFDDKKIDGFHGQDVNITSYNLARMNMFLHDVNYEKFLIRCGDTLLNPLHNDETPYDAIVSNPPYSLKWIGKDDPTLINDERFAPAGALAPKSYADFAFILHALNYLSTAGRAAIVTFPGIFYRKGAEHKIREYLVNNNYIEAIIQLPSNLFFGTSIATCILVLAKNKTTNNVLFIDASNEFKKETNNNILTEDNIQRILETFKAKENIDHFAKVVSKEEIAKNTYNLSVSQYVQKQDTREKIDIKVLNQQIKEITSKVNNLRLAIDDIIKELEHE